MTPNATDLLYDRIVMMERAYNEERDRADGLAERLDTLHTILSDPVNQLEQTKTGYYIYRFNLEAMHRIADALGIERLDPVMTCYTLAELTQLIQPD